MFETDPLIEYFLHEARKDAKSDNPLRIKTMLGGASKLGPRSLVRQFSRSLAGSCCCPRPDGSMPSTPPCRAHCYGHQTTSGRDSVTLRLDWNDKIVRREDFHLLLACRPPSHWLPRLLRRIVFSPRPAGFHPPKTGWVCLPADTRGASLVTWQAQSSGRLRI